MTGADNLIDTSALAPLLLGPTTAEWDDHVKRTLNAHSTWCPMPDGIHRRARVVQELLTTEGEHRSADPSTCWSPPRKRRC